MATRADLEDLALRKIGRIFSKHKNQLAREISVPFLIKDTPVGLLGNQQGELESELRETLFVLHAGMVRGNITNGKKLANAHADRASNLANQIIGNTQRRLKSLKGLQTQTKINEQLAIIFNPARAATLAQTEVTEAQAAVKRAQTEQRAESRDELFILVWLLRPCKHCQFCPLMHNMPEEFFTQFVPGPPAHPNCCCELKEHFFSTVAERKAFIKERLSQAPNENDVRATAKKIGISL